MAVSIDIGTRAVHIIIGEAKKSGHITIKNSDMIMIPANMLAEDQIQQQRSLFTIIKPALSQMNVKRTDCNFTLADDRFLAREFSLPKCSESDLRGLARQEMISQYGAAEDDVVEVQVLARQPDGTVAIRAAAYSKALTDGYFKFAIESSLSPRSLDYHSDSIKKLVSYKPEINGDTIADKNVILADLGMFACIVHVVSYGRTVFSRCLPVGFGELSHVISGRGIPGDSNNANSLEAASFNQRSAEYNSYPPHVSQQIEAFFYKLADEMSKTLRFLSTSKVVDHVDALYMFGGGSQIPGLAPRLGKAIAIRTEDVQTVSTITAPVEIYDKLPLLLNCAGSLL